MDDGILSIHTTDPITAAQLAKARPRSGPAWQEEAIGGEYASEFEAKVRFEAAANFGQLPGFAVRFGIWIGAGDKLGYVWEINLASAKEKRRSAKATEAEVAQRAMPTKDNVGPMLFLLRSKSFSNELVYFPDTP